MTGKGTPRGLQDLATAYFLIFIALMESLRQLLYPMEASTSCRNDRFRASPFIERNCKTQTSATGCYETNESGRFEIDVQRFPEPSGKWHVSTGGGIQPRWSADGKELYFIAPDGKLTITASGETFAAGTPAALFPAGIAPGSGINKQQYMVSHDGRFLINQPAESSTTTPITLILNWHPKL